MTTQGPITIYNKRLGTDRRDVYYPTRIGAASYAEKMGSLHSDGSTEESVSYKLRIPADAEIEASRLYSPETAYKRYEPERAIYHWTIGHLDLIVRGDPLVDGPADEKTIRDAASAEGRQVIIVEEYADNTERGSPAVRHWRIGGR